MGVHEPLADGVSDLERDERAHEVEHRCDRDRATRTDRTRRDRGGDDIGGVVEAVGEVERERGRDDDDQDDVDAHVFLMTTPSSTYAARSVESIASSRRSKMSFQRITTIGSIPSSNREAIASRTMRSP